MSPIQRLSLSFIVVAMMAGCAANPSNLVALTPTPISTTTTTSEASSPTPTSIATATATGVPEVKPTITITPEPAKKDENGYTVFADGLLRIKFNGDAVKLNGDLTINPDYSKDGMGANAKIKQSLMEAFAGMVGFGDGDAAVAQLQQAMAKSQKFSVSARPADSNGGMHLGPYDDPKKLEVDLSKGLALKMTVGGNVQAYPIRMSDSGLIFGVSPDGQLWANFAIGSAQFMSEGKFPGQQDYGFSFEQILNYILNMTHGGYTDRLVLVLDDFDKYAEHIHTELFQYNADKSIIPLFKLN